MPGIPGFMACVAGRRRKNLVRRFAGPVKTPARIQRPGQGPATAKAREAKASE